jgi:hypothetical protein
MMDIYFADFDMECCMNSINQKKQYRKRSRKLIRVKEFVADYVIFINEYLRPDTGCQRFSDLRVL